MLFGLALCIIKGQCAPVLILHQGKTHTHTGALATTDIQWKVEHHSMDEWVWVGYTHTVKKSVYFTYSLDVTETGVLSMLTSLLSWSFRFCARSASDILCSGCMCVCVEAKGHSVHCEYRPGNEMQVKGDVVARS